MSTNQFFSDRIAALGTKHSKELVIGPTLKELLGLNVKIPNNFDSDKFGTFTGDKKRQNTQKDTAKLKAKEAMEILDLDIGIGSEGSFNSDPNYPSLIMNTEVVVLIDKRYGFEVYGISNEIVDYAHATSVHNIQELLDFAKTINFPKCAIVLRESDKNHSDMIKGIRDMSELKKHSEKMFENYNSIWVETDLRAHVNETRMAHIKKATINLAENINRCCPQCDRPGFSLVTIKRGLPCEACNRPTGLILSEVYKCDGCGFENTLMYPNVATTAYSGYCDYCNP